MEKVSLENTLGANQKKKMGEIPSRKECELVIGTMKDNKAPGLDGIPIEFYKSFWHSLCDLFMSMVNECWLTKDMPISMKTAVLSLIHKGKSKDNLKNYRPISLMNSDYKILAFVFADRLQTVIQSIINTDQSGYIKNRYIGCNIRNILDIYDICENENIPGALICIDYEKAFDSVEHNFITLVLQKFNFDQQFIEWINIFYNQPMFRVKNNGWISQSYEMKRGVRQGCPLSALLFILVVEILAT